jgi:hypothetical protein
MVLLLKIKSLSGVGDHQKQANVKYPVYNYAPPIKPMPTSVLKEKL